ncbi:MAG: HAD-IA family hydrolase [bacterium]
MARPLGPLFEQVFGAVLFDLDGTLIDSTPAVDRSWATWAAEFGLEGHPVLAVHGLPAGDKVRAIATAGDLPADQVAAAVARITEIELSDIGGVVALPGAVAALTAVLDDRLAIVTSCTAALAAVRLSAAGLNAPAVLVTVDQLTHGKPDPEGYLTAARRTGHPPSRCLVVEDAPGGLAAAAAAGCRTLAVTTTTAAADLPADAVVGTLADIVLTADARGIRVGAA